MRRIKYILAVFVTLYLVTSCSEGKKTNDIITHKQEVKTVKKTVQKIGDYEQTRTIDWHGSVYNVSIERKADNSLSIVDDGTGNKYYDNRIMLRITGKDGLDVLKRSFTKEDFSKYVGADYLKNNVLLGLVFDRVDDDYIYFAASVGAPDKMSDEYIPLVVRFSYKNYKLDVYRDTMLDTANSNDLDNSEVELSKEEGV